MPAGGRKVGGYNKDSRVILAAVQEFLKTHRHVTVRFCLYHVVSLRLKHPDTGEIIIPSTAEKYEIKLYGLLSRARVAGDIDDEPFVDNRCSVVLGGSDGYENLAEYMEPPDIDGYRRNRWQDQAKHVTEVWLEKDTFAVLIRPTISKWDCTLRVASGGYGRAFLYRAARELADIEKAITILYLGDFDPSGLVIEERARKGNDKEGADRREGLFDILIKQFGWTEERFNKQVKWIRVAATEEDLKNPALQKFTISAKQAGVDPETREEIPGDSRAPAFVKKYGERCLEIEALDILNAGSIGERLDKAIRKYGVNVAAWKRSEETQEREKEEWTRKTASPAAT